MGVLLLLLLLIVLLQEASINIVDIISSLIGVICRPLKVIITSIRYDDIRESLAGLLVHWVYLHVDMTG